MINRQGIWAGRGERHERVRRQWCDARLFDTDGRIAEPENRLIELHVKCWRCRGVNSVYLAPGDDQIVEVIGQNP